MAISENPRRSWRRGRLGATRIWWALASATGTGWLLWHVVTAVRGSRTAPWDLGRASGLTSYVLLVLLVSSGLLLAHPATRRLRWPGPRRRVRLHATLAVFTLAFTLLHVVVLATDPWAHVGWAGALLPVASHYRPVGVTLGVLAVWSGVVAGTTAALAGRALGRLWWPLHKAAGLMFLLAWAHGVLAGSDSAALAVGYLASGGAVLTLALSRYQARSPDDLRDETALASRPRGRPVHSVAAGRGDER